MPDSKEFSPSLPRAAANRQGPSSLRPAFSLLELVIVILILSVISAIAIPRLSRGSQGTADAAMQRDTQVMQKALDLYAAEHSGAFPPPPTVTHQLTMYTDARGVVSSTKAPPYEFGPYLRKVPALAAGPNKGSYAIATAPAAGVGWIYDPAEGTITANMTPPVVASAPAE